MPYVFIDHAVAFAIDAPIKASDLQKLDQNIDYLKALMAIATGHTHNQAGTDQGGPVVPADGTVTDLMMADYTVGEVLFHSNPAVVNNNQQTPTKHKETLIGHAGTFRVRWSFMGSGANGYTQLYKNGVAIAGTYYVQTLGSYTTYTADIALVKGDLIQVYAWRSGGGNPFVKDLNLYVADDFDTTFTANL